MLAAFAPELEFQNSAQDLAVLIPQSRQAERAILFGVLFIPNADISGFEQFDNRREHLSLWHAWTIQVAVRDLADARQRFAKGLHTIEFDEIASSPVVGMISILLAPFRVPAHGLDVSVCAGRNPHRTPCGRDRPET